MDTERFDTQFWVQMVSATKDTGRICVIQGVQMVRTYIVDDLETDPSSEEIEKIVTQIAELVRKHYEGRLKEPIPDDILDILEKLNIDLTKTPLH